jgi:hypothetical protein
MARAIPPRRAMPAEEATARRLRRKLILAASW